jgi:hypothetical protein
LRNVEDNEIEDNVVEDDWLDSLFLQARSRAEAVVRAAAAAEQLQQMEIQMEDSGDMVEPVGSGKVYARAEGEEPSPSSPSTILLFEHGIDS